MKNKTQYNKLDNNIVELQNKLDSLENDVYMAISGYAILTRDIDYINYRFSKLRKEIKDICEKKQ